VTNPTPATPEGSSSFASNSLLDDYPDAGKEVEPRETPVSPSRGLNVQAILGGATPAPATALAGQTPSEFASSRQVPPPTGLATSALTAPSTSGMAAPSGFGLAPSSTHAMAAPVALAAMATPAPSPVFAENPAPPSALKGLFIGVGLALLIIVAAASVYFYVVNG
jgi:hypothetical protein